MGFRAFFHRLVTALIAATLAYSMAVAASVSTSVAESKGGSSVAATARTILDQALIARNPDTRKVAVEALGMIGPHEPYLGRLLPKRSGWTDDGSVC